MHNAPSVSYPVGRCRWQRGIYASVVLLTVVVLCAWVSLQGYSWAFGLACAAAMVGAWSGARTLRQTATLVWDGQVWCLHSQSQGAEDAFGTVQAVVDLQKALLLHWQPTSDTLPVKSQWLWLGADVASASWLELRRAVFQRVHP